MKKNVFVLLRAFVFMVLMPALSICLVACEPDNGVENVGDINAGDDVSRKSSEDSESSIPTAASYHEAVDLGLSVRWATCNIGAESPENYGGYYAWGEVGTKSPYTENGYQYYNNGSFSDIGSEISATKYDVARMVWGGVWRMPALKEFDELCHRCTFQSAVVKGVKGYKVTGPNGNSIFLPTAGYCGGEGVSEAGEFGYYWASTLYPYSNDCAYCLSFGEYSEGWQFNPRYEGLSVRPVIEKKQFKLITNRYAVSSGATTIEVELLTDMELDCKSLDASWVRKRQIDKISGGYRIVLEVDENPSPNTSREAHVLIFNSEYAVADTLTIAQKRQSTVPYSVAVDLGLSVMWASYNVGAESPEEKGALFAWGEVETKSSYDVLNYLWSYSEYECYYDDIFGEQCREVSRQWLRYCVGNSYLSFSHRYSEGDGITILAPEDDVAHVKWGGDWRMPTKNEISELYSKCSWEETAVKGVNGYKVTGPNGNSIFFLRGSYWSATLDTNDRENYSAYSYSSSLESTYRFAGLCVRPVTE